MVQERISDLFFYSALAYVTPWRIPYCTNPLFYLEKNKTEKSFLNSELLEFRGFSIVATTEQPL